MRPPATQSPIQQQLQDFRAEVGQANGLRHLIHLAEDALHHGGAVNYPGIFAQRDFFQNPVDVDPEVLQPGLQRPARRRELQSDRQAVIMSGWEYKPSRMTPPAVQLHVPRAHVGYGVLTRRVFHTSLTAVIDGQQLRSGYEAGIEILHVEIVVIERHAREHRIDGHCAVAGFVAKLPYGAFLALRQQKRARLKHAQIVWHCRHLLQTVNLN